MNWIRFFFGTPVRFLTTAIVTVVLTLISVFFPGAIHKALLGLATEVFGAAAYIVAPLIYPLAVILLILLGYKTMFSGIRKK